MPEMRTAASNPVIGMAEDLADVVSDLSLVSREVDDLRQQRNVLIVQMLEARVTEREVARLAGVSHPYVHQLKARALTSKEGSDA